MERDYLARQVSAVTAIANGPAVITVATDLPAEATHFVVTAVDGPNSLTLTLTGTTGPIAYFFNYGMDPGLKIDLRTAGLTELSLDSSNAGYCTLAGFWMG